MIRRWLARWLGPELNTEIERLRRELHIEQAGRGYAYEQWMYAGEAADRAAARLVAVRTALESGEDSETVLDRIAEAVREGRHHA